MIEPTDEMVEVLFSTASGGEFASAEDVRAGLAAVLAIVERDYDITPKRCGANHPDESVLGFCGLLAGHEGNHLDPTALASVTW